MSRKPDRTRVVQAVILASAHGLREASRRTGVSKSRISQWRAALEAETGDRFRRRHDLKTYPRQTKLTAAQAAELRAYRAQGRSWRWLSIRYGIGLSTARRYAGALPRSGRLGPSVRSRIAAALVHFRACYFRPSWQGGDLEYALCVRPALGVPDAKDLFGRRLTANPAAVTCERCQARMARSAASICEPVELSLEAA